MYRRFFKDRFAAYCELAHRYGLKTMYHTCGNVAPLVGDFVDAGLDILQSLQPRAMGEQLAWLKKEYGSRLAFQGGIDIQGVLPRGTPQEVAAHVQSRAAILGEGGGYIFGTAHSILPDTPTENILALVEAYHQYGKY
jgi:uroporphyrinogen decarboxylase